MKTIPPKIDDRTFSKLMGDIRDLIPRYTPEWAGNDDKDPGVALLKIFTHMTENVIHRFNQVPHKNFVAFLDMLGIKLLPAQPARVPVTFYLAKGTDKEILIPARTQTSTKKTDEHEKLTFETEKNLLAIPSLLKKVFSIDPEKDAIYTPPPGFLEASLQVERSYTIVSSPSVGSKDFQLDHVTDLKEGDFLRIGNGVNIEYGIVSGISGMIIKIEDTLLFSHPAGTPVEKVTKFNLFEGKNMQEHSLYIGHKDLFNVKSTAQFILSITHREGTQTGIDPLEVSWEYWGEVKGEEEARWVKFNPVDLSRGLSIDGDIYLNKMQEGEIKEREINGIKSRWIRCILDKSLPVNESRILPRLDNITFRVLSSGEKILPDLAFNNDTPLDTTLPFTPFGKEPRMFDNFSIASKEAFSKKGGRIEIEADVEQRGILGPTTAISAYKYLFCWDDIIREGNYDALNELLRNIRSFEKNFIANTEKNKQNIYANIIKVFARGTYGRLVEVEIDPGGEAEWKDHGFPPDTKIAAASAPSVIHYPLNSAGSPFLEENISVFARAENGHLVEWFYDGSQEQWMDHETPGEGIDVCFDPFSIYADDTGGNKVISVFATGSDGHLYEFNQIYNGNVGINGWKDCNKPSDTDLDSSPYAVRYEPDSENRIEIWIKGKNGQLYQLRLDSVERNNESDWICHNSPEDENVASRPFALLSKGNVLTVYIKGDKDNLLKYSVSGWKTLPDKPDGLIVHSSPHGYFDDGLQENHIFIRSDDNNLWEVKDPVEDDERKCEWKEHESPPNIKLNYSPWYERCVFSASMANSILSRVINSHETWNEYKDPMETALTPVLSWEYWNSKGWAVLKGLKDETSHFLKSGTIDFPLPADIEETEIAGQKSFWIRARIVGGDYGRESFSLVKDKETEEQKLIFSKESIRPPIINKLTISYDLETEQYPQHCTTYNNLAYLDQTDANKIVDKYYYPFVKLEERYKTLYLGFEKYFKDGPVRIFFLANELTFTDEQKPKMEWTYSKKNDWCELDHYDGTEGLIMAEILELLGPSDFSARTEFGSYLYWIKGSLTKGEYEEWPLLEGIYPNTTWALQAETIKDETPGSGNGEPDQIFKFLKIPVLNGEIVRIREILSEEEKLSLKTASGEDAIHEVKDDKGNVIETWVLWSEVPDFFDSKENSRHYTLDHATGEIQFGDGINGMIPQTGENNIKAFSYRWGGGKQGNVRAGDIKTLKSPVSGVDSVSNATAADGGADTVTLDRMLEVGPARISHRNRAVTVDDFEWLAMEASRKLAKVRCLPNTNNKMEKETGWVTVIIVPDSPDDEPSPSLELKRKVKQYLEEHCVNTISSANHVHVTGPWYLKISVSMDVFIPSIDAAGEVERKVNKKLRAFFHPLTGGPEGKGWDFGRDVSVSDLYAIIEKIQGVDHIENLKFAYNETEDGDIVNVKSEFLVANGIHDVNLQLVKGDGNL